MQEQLSETKAVESKLEKENIEAKKDLADAVAVNTELVAQRNEVAE